CPRNESVSSGGSFQEETDISESLCGSVRRRRVFPRQDARQKSLLRGRRGRVARHTWHPKVLRQQSLPWAWADLCLSMPEENHRPLGEREDRKGKTGAQYSTENGRSRRALCLTPHYIHRQSQQNRNQHKVHGQQQHKNLPRM